MISPLRRYVITAVVGFLAAAATAIITFTLAPHSFVTASSLLATAAGSSFAAFAAALFSVRLTSRILSLAHPDRLGVRTALAAAWFAPLLVFASQRSWLALALWVAAAVEVTRLSWYVSSLADKESGQGHQGELQSTLFTTLDQSWGCSVDSVIGSFCLEATLGAAVGSRFVLAGFFLVGGTIALVRCGWRMLRDSPLGKETNLRRRSLVAVAIPTLLMAFAWLPRAGGHGTGSLGGDGGVFGVSLTRHTWYESTHKKEHRQGVQGATPIVLGTVFPGVILYPEVEPHTKLIAPPARWASGFPSSPSRQFTIPFNGVYWFWRPPADHPPESAVVKHGSPAKLTFRSTDGAPLWMEARQNLGSQIDLHCCGAIEVEVENADSRPETVAIELTLRSTSAPGEPYESLGMQQLLVRAPTPDVPVIEQTLSFRVPNHIKLRTFDELTIRFRLKWWRGDQSAKIAISRFVLVPRG